MSIWIYKHDNGKGIKKESISNLVSSPSCWQSACDLKKRKKGKIKEQAKRSKRPLSVYYWFKRKASRAGVWPKHRKVSALEFVIPEIYNKLLIKQRTCFARVSSNHSFLHLCAKTQGHTHIQVISPVTTSQFIWPVVQRTLSCISVTRKPSRVGHQRSSRRLTLTRATRACRQSALC